MKRLFYTFLLTALAVVIVILYDLPITEASITDTASETSTLTLSEAYYTKNTYDQINMFSQELCNFSYRILLADYSLKQSETKYLELCYEFIEYANLKLKSLNDYSATITVTSSDKYLINELLSYLNDSIIAYSDTLAALEDYHFKSNIYSNVIHNHTLASKRAYDVWSVSLEHSYLLDQAIRSQF